MHKTPKEQVREKIVDARKRWLDDIETTASITLFEISEALRDHEYLMKDTLEDETPAYRTAYEDTSEFLDRISEISQLLDTLHDDLRHKNSPLMVPRRTLNYQEKKEFFHEVRDYGEIDTMTIVMGDTTFELSPSELRKILGTL